MAKSKKPETKIHSSATNHGTMSIDSRTFRVVLAEVPNNGRIDLTLNAEPGVQGFLIVLKESLPVIR